MNKKNFCIVRLHTQKKNENNIQVYSVYDFDYIHNEKVNNIVQRTLYHLQI